MYLNFKNSSFKLSVCVEVFFPSSLQPKKVDLSAAFFFFLNSDASGGVFFRTFFFLIAQNCFARSSTVGK